MTAAGTRTASLAALVLVTAVLYFARELLIPLALAILLAFLLAPAARRLERLRLGRVVSTLAVVSVAFGVIGGVGWVAFHQAVSLAAKLPEYRANIHAKIRALRAPGDGPLGKAAEAIKELQREADPAPEPLPVRESGASAFEQLAGFVAPFVKPVGSALATLVFTILLLLNREGMRERLIALIGAQRISVTTQALREVSARVSRYLTMQLLVNAAFGVPFGVALYFIGTPNAVLWGLLATLLRFIPYAGVWIAAAMPALLAFAISDGWSMIAWTVGVFLALEIVLVYAVEPWVYGRSAGLSTIAIIAAAIFWTWLWGPVGLLLATPLTVCVAVVGRYIPELGYLNVLLGVEPALPPEARIYQRLLALDQEEAEELAAGYAAEHGAAALGENVLIPLLRLAEQDRHRDALEPARQRFVFRAVRGMAEALENGPEPPPGAGTVCIVAARDEADHIAGMILAQRLPAQGLAPRLIPSPILAAETLEQIAAHACRAVCISAVPPHAATDAANLCKRLRKRLPHLKVVVALWAAEDPERIRARLQGAGVDEVAAGVPAAIEQLRRFAG